MKTNDLIRALAADNATRAASVERWLMLALVAATAVSVAMFFLILGPRADIAVAAGQFGFWFKFAVTLTLAATAAIVATRLARPGVDVRFAAIALAAAPLLLIAAVAVELMQVAPSMRATKLVGTTWRSCLTFIPLLSAPILFGALIALRHGAPTQPAFSGAAAGVLAGGLGAAVYASYCVEDSAFFLATWYSLAIAIVSIVGAAVGSRWLRW
jgi:hypothetical protein